MKFLRALILFVVVQFYSTAQSISVLTAPGAAIIASKKVASGGGGGGGGGTSDPAFITAYTPNTFNLRNNFSGKLGIGFTLTSTVTITWLARWVVPGNSQTHTVRLFNSSGTELANVSVNCSGAATDAFLKGAITPQVCVPGLYYVMSDETNGGDQWHDSDTITYTAGLTSDVTSYYNDGAFHNTSPDQSYVPVNFGSH